MKANPVSGHELLKNKQVLITAAAGTGIGSATALRCAEEGATTVVLSDVHEKRLNETVERIAKQQTSTRVLGKLCDVRDEKQVGALFQFCSSEMGHVDILVNNAGLGGSAALVDMTDEQWQIVLDVTLGGTFRMTRAALRHMREHDGGVIVNNASVLGWRAQKEQAHYAAAKAGVMALTRCAAMEAVEYNVRINAVAPSLAVHEFLNRASSDKLLSELASKEAYGRGAQTWEVANVIVFLASAYSGYMTGEVVSVSSQHP
jgi:3-oxoacyl-[acyl-carrier protein] reductase